MRALVPRERVDALRGFGAAADFFAAGLRAADERLLPLLDDLARAAAGFFVAPRFAVERFAVDPLADDLRAPPWLRVEPDEEPPELVLALPSIDHLPVMTR